MAASLRFAAPSSLHAMNLQSMLLARAAGAKPLRVALIVAGKFGAMYLAQTKHTPGIHIVAIADLSPDHPCRGKSRRRRP